MTTQIKVTDKMVEKAMAAYRASGGAELAGIRAALEAALQEENFEVGDQVTCVHGSVSGVILSIVGDEALISWSCRGKSTAKLGTLEHADETAIAATAN